ncbi:hypothetical protein B0J12DRAFT_760573, partial [Macrophomina phaseolina]
PRDAAAGPLRGRVRHPLASAASSAASGRAVRVAEDSMLRAQRMAQPVSPPGDGADRHVKISALCPLLATEFKRGGEPEDNAIAQVTAAAAIALYDRFRLHASPKPNRRGPP